MAFKLEMKNPEQPEGTLFDLGGLGIKNGESLTLTEDQEQAVVARHGATLKDALGNNVYLKVSGTSEMSKKEVGEILKVVV